MATQKINAGKVVGKKESFDISGGNVSSATTLKMSMELSQKSKTRNLTQLNLPCMCSLNSPSHHTVAIHAYDGYCHTTRHTNISRLVSGENVRMQSGVLVNHKEG